VIPSEPYMTAELTADVHSTAHHSVVQYDEVFTRMLRGDDSAFELLFVAFDAKLRRYLSRQIGTASTGPLVEDMLQEVWIRFINLRKQPPSKVNAPFHVQAFLFRVAHNMVIDRRRTWKQHTSIDSLDEHQHPVTRHHTALDAEEIVERAFAQLPDDFREVLELNLHLGYRFDEIAEMLDKTPEAIWQRASRARAKLRHLVVEIAKKEGVSLSKFTSPVAERKSL